MDVPLKVQAKGLQAFLDKTDGRDKLLATVQYAALMISAGEAGDAKRIQTSVATARKVFRIFRPLEALNPILQNPTLNSNKPLVLEILVKLKPLLMSLYFLGDHVVWAQQSGLMNRPEEAASAQTASLYGWFGGSLCTIAIELMELNALVARRAGEKEAEYQERMASITGELRRRGIILIHSILQAALACGLLGLRPMKPRTIGLMGTLTSALNCYMLYPVVRSFLPAKPAAKSA